jgi:hypothetical protein
MINSLSKASNEKQFENEFAELQVLLKGKEAEENWEQRDKALIRLTKLAESGAKLECFAPLLKTVIESILNSVIRI